jgi:hypothetical protein
VLVAEGKVKDGVDAEREEPSSGGEQKGGSRKKKLPDCTTLQLLHHTTLFTGRITFSAPFSNFPELQQSIHPASLYFFTLLFSLYKLGRHKTIQHVVHAQCRPAAATSRAWSARGP